MRAEKKIVYQRAIIVRPRHLKDICELITRYSDKAPVLAVECTDGLKLSPVTLDELLELPNYSVSRIISIQLRTSYSNDPDISVVLGSYAGDVHIIIDASGNKDEIVGILGQLDEIVRDCFPWYSRIVSNNFFWIYLLFVLMLITGADVIAYHFGLFTKTVFFPIIVISWLMFMTASFLSSWLLHSIFPAYLFTIGDGERQESQYENRRRFISQGIVVALFVGIAGSIIASFLVRH